MGSFARSLGGSSSGSSAPTIASQLSALGIDTSQFTKPVPAGEPQGPLGWLGGLAGNVLGDVGEFAAGLGQLGGMTLSDIVTAGTDVIEKPLSMVGAMEDKDHNYFADDFAKTLVFDPELYSKKGLSAAISPGTQSYLEEAYGVNPLKADLWPDVGKVGHTLYNDPLMTALDVYGGASFFGRRAGNRAVKSYRRLDKGADVPATLRRTLPGLDPQLPSLYDDPTKPELFLDSPGGVRRRMLEAGGKPALELDRLPINPVTRGVRNRLHNLMTYEVDSMGDDVKQFAERFKELPDSEAQMQLLNSLEPELAQNVRLYNQAKEWGVTRLDRPTVAKLRVRSDGAKRIANWRSTTYRLRNQDIQKIQEAFHPDLSEEQIKNFYKTAQGYAPRRSPGMLPFTEVSRMIDNGGEWLSELPDYDKITKVWGDLKTHITENADNPEEIAATLEYAEDLSEYLQVSRQMLKRSPDVDPEAATIARLRWARHDLIAESIKHQKMGGYLTEMRRSYGPQLLERHAPRLEDLDPVTGRQKFDTFAFDEVAGDAIGPDGTEFWKQARNEFKGQGLQAPVYFPHIDARKMNKSDVLLRSGSGMRQTVEAPFSKNEYINLVQGTYLTDDPIEAYSRRAAQVRKIVETEKFIEGFIEQFGRKVNVMDEIGPMERYFSPVAFKKLYRNRAEIDAALSKASEVGDDSFMLGSAVKDSSATLKAQRDALKDAIERIADDAEETLKSPAMKDVYAIPATVARQLESFSKFQVGPMGRIFWDGPTNVWRSAVLAFSPRWILNNLLGNAMFLKLQGGQLSEVVKYATSPRFRKMVDDFIETLPENVRAQVGEGMFDSSQMSRTSLGSAANTEAGKLAQRAKESRIVKPFSNWARKMEHWNGNIEDAFRKVSLMTAIDKRALEVGLKRNGRSFFRSMTVLENIAKEGLTPKLFAKAVDDVNYFFNDYAKMSSFERNVIRRGVAPFWSFYKHVGKLTLSYPFTHPERATAIRFLGQLGQEMDEENQELLPAYLRNSLPFGGGADPADTRFLNTRGANPLELASQVTEDPFGTAGQMLGPQLGTAFELVSGRDALTGQPFTSPDTGAAFGFDNRYKAVFDELGNITGVESTPTNVRPGLVESLIGQLPPVGLARNLISQVPGVGEPGVGRRYSTGEEITEGGANKYPLDMVQQLLQMGGVSTTDFNVPEHIERQATERQQALVQILRNLGVMAPVE